MGSWQRLLSSVTVAVLVLFAQEGLTLPAVDNFGDYDAYQRLNETFGSELSGQNAIQKRAGVPLRILSLGASIMSGVGSSSGNGLRKPLRDALRLDGWEVNMVGSLRAGTMKDNEHEAVPGDIITQLRARLPNSIGFKPNVVIINCGTNDATRAIDVGTAGNRMNDILNDLWAAPDMGNTCIILSTLIPTTDGTGKANRPTINDQYRALVTKRAGEGKCIYVADMVDSYFNTATEYSDSVHPNDAGHKKMASVFFQAIMQAANAGKIKAAGAFGAVSPVCDKFAGTGIDAGGLTQRGVGAEDGIYLHNSEEKGIILEVESSWDRNQWRFARLFNRNYDDFLGWFEVSATEHAFGLWANSADGNGKFTKIADLKPDLFCNPPGVRFIDMTGDGLDDLVCIAPNGDAYLSVNQGDGNRAAGKPPTFKRVSSTALIKTREGYDQARVVLADIDGDGRGDYGVIDDGGDVWFWRNGWIDPIPKYWQALGKRFDSTNIGNLAGIRFEDINGDGRDDMMWIDDVGQTTTWTNARSCAKGLEGNGLNVAWRQGFHAGASSGPTHAGIPGYATGTNKIIRDRLHFARIYGQVSVFGNLPLQDYVFVQHDEPSTGKHKFTVRAWKNLGAGGTKLLADGDKYCNMAGHSDGREDYVWTWSTGKMELYINRGKGHISDSDPDGYWDASPGVIWTPPRDMNRRDLHLADWDGDGDCDIIYVNPDSGAVEVFINKFLETGKWTFTSIGNPAPALTCPHKRGLAIFDLAVRFADLTGNKRADYLCLAPDGRVTGFVQENNGAFTNVGQIKFSEEKDRANLRWTDVNGDGKDDMVWIEKFSGDTFVWYNNKRGNPGEFSGSAFEWRKQDAVAYSGLSAGTCIYYADLNGDGRSDEHYILGTFNNQAMTSLSPSCGLVDVTGDDGSFDGNLPPPPVPAPTSPCIAGTGPGNLAGICRFVCSYDYCLAPCTCTAWGTGGRIPISLGIKGTAKPGSAEGVDKICASSCDKDYCPLDVCVTDDDWQRIKCVWDPNQSSSWELSRAQDLMDGFILLFGAKNWIAGMDVMFYLLSGYSPIDCNNFDSNDCVSPQGACKDWPSSSYWYIRIMAARINSLFTFAHEKLQDSAIRNLAKVDQMVLDFKREVPNNDLLTQIFKNIPIAAGVASLLTKRASALGGDFFTLLGSAFYFINANRQAKVVDYNGVASGVKSFVGDSFDAVNNHLEHLLPAIFGNGDENTVKDNIGWLQKSGLTETKGNTDIAKLLYGGAMMVPITQSQMADAMTDAIEGTMASVLGHVLAGLQHIVVETINTKAGCAMTPGTWWKVNKDIFGGEEFQGTCFYLVVRPNKASKSEGVKADAITKIKDAYKVDMEAMYKNVAACNNGGIDASADLYLGSDKYPPCYFGLPYVDATGVADYPLAGRGIGNQDKLPKWILGGGVSDLWNEPREKFCSIDAYKDYVVCKN